MISAWAYLDTFDAIYCSTDINQIKILEETAPGFFSLTQSALIESAFSRIARLMDPKKSCGLDNLNFTTLCHRCSEQQVFNNPCEAFSIIAKEWKEGEYESLRTHRNKIQSHNDLSMLSQAQPLVTSKLSLQDVQLLKQLHEKLWSLLENINAILFNSALLKPTYGALNQRPVAFLDYLKAGLQVSKNVPELPELNQNINDAKRNIS